MPSFFNVKRIREEIAELLAHAQALSDLAGGEEREMTADETAEFDRVMNEIGNSGADGQPKTGKYLECERAEKLEGLKALQLADTRPVPVPLDQQASGSRPLSQSITIPAQCRYRHGKLKAYSGPKADEQAYIAGRFILGTLFKHESSRDWCQENGIDCRVQNALKEGDNSLGGYLVPEEMEAAIINRREEYGVFRRESRTTPMGSDTKTVPRRASGLTGYFVNEGGTLTESDKGWDDIQLVAKKLAVLTRYSSELSEDAIISIGDDLTDEIAYAFALKEDQCGFIGDGTSTYGGMTGVINAMAAGSIYTAAAGNTAFSTLDYADFEGVVGQLPEYAEANAKWYVSKVGFWQSMARLANATGGNTTDNAAAGPNVRQFQGYPVVISQVLNSTVAAQTSTNILAFGDLSLASTFGNRRGMSIMFSEHAYFTTDQIAIRGIERFDINVHERGTASAAGAMIVLATPGS